jgi:hypothetical protein
MGPTGNWLRKGGNRFGPKEGFFCGNHFGGRYGGNRNSDLVGGRFYSSKLLRQQKGRELEAGTRWWMAVPFEVTSVTKERRVGNQHPLEEGFSF